MCDSTLFHIRRKPNISLFSSTEPKLWTDSNRHTPSEAFQKSFPFKIYLQSHRCKGILDRFELPHYSTCRKQGVVEKDVFSAWIDSNHRIGLKPLQTVNTKLRFSFHGQIRTIENQIMTYRRQRKSHGNKPWQILFDFNSPTNWNLMIRIILCYI